MQLVAHHARHFIRIKGATVPIEQHKGPAMRRCKWPCNRWVELRKATMQEALARGQTSSLKRRIRRIPRDVVTLPVSTLDTVANTFFQVLYERHCMGRFVLATPWKRLYFTTASHRKLSCVIHHRQFCDKRKIRKNASGWSRASLHDGRYALCALTCVSCYVRPHS
jgi:hypothetical protein